MILLLAPILPALAAAGRPECTIPSALALAAVDKARLALALWPCATNQSTGSTGRRSPVVGAEPVRRAVCPSGRMSPSPGRLEGVCGARSRRFCTSRGRNQTFADKERVGTQNEKDDRTNGVGPGGWISFRISVFCALCMICSRLCYFVRFCSGFPNRLLHSSLCKALMLLCVSCLDYTNGLANATETRASLCMTLIRTRTR